MERSFEHLLMDAREGSAEAASDLVETYAPHVLRAVRRMLNREIRGKFDSEDFVQAVWASFFTAPEKLDGVTHPDQLVGLLATMARNKVVDEVRRRLMTQKYAIQRERSLADTPAAVSHQLASREPTPSEFAIARERWLRLLRQQPERNRQVIRMKLMGRSTASIARALDVSERTVQRIMDRIIEADNDERHNST